MKRKIFLILMVVLSFAGKVSAQVDTLNVSIDSLSSNGYFPNTKFTVTEEYQRNFGSSDSLHMKCYLSPTVVYVPTTGDNIITGSDAGGNYVLYNVENFGGSSHFQFSVMFTTDSCATTAVFKPVISANNASSFTGASAEAICNIGALNWSLNYYGSAMRYNNWGAYQGFYLGQPVSLDYYYNGQCNTNTFCNDTLYLYLYTANLGQQNLKNAVVRLNFNQPDGVIQVFDNDNNNVPLSHYSDGADSSTYQYYNYVDNNTGSHTLYATNGYYGSTLMIVVNPQQFNTPICFSATLQGNDVCTNDTFSQTYPSTCITIDTVAANIFPQVYGGSGQTAVGCSNGFFYGFTSNVTCNSSCTMPIEDAGVAVTVPHQVQINSITLPTVTGSDAAVLTGHYYSSATVIDSFSFSYNADSAINGTSVPLSTLVGAGHNAANCFISDYKITSTLSNIRTVNLGYNGYTILATEWPAMTVPVTTNEAINFPVDLFTANFNTLYTYSSTIVSTSSSPISIDNQSVCTNQSIYCIGDTVEYSVNLQNQGYGNLTKSVLEGILPTGFKYVPGSATCQSTIDVIYGNGGCYCPRCVAQGYVGLNYTNQPIIDFAQNDTSSTNLKWYLPTLPYACNQQPPIYVVTYKAVITSAAVYSVNGEQSISYILDSSGNILNGQGDNINLCKQYPILTPEKQVSVDSIHWVQDTTALPGQTIYYRIILKNNGDIPLDSIRLVDILPFVNDHTVLNCNTPRNSTAFVSLTSTLKNPSGVNAVIQYSVDNSPVRAQFLGFPNTVSCESGGFYPFAALNADIQSVRAFEIDYGNSVLLPGDSNVYVYSAQIPINSPDSSVAYNTFAFTATAPNGDGTNSRLAAAESANVGIRVVEPACQCVEGTAWVDSVGDGIQNAQEPGINNVLISIYSSINNTLKGTTFTTFDTAHSSGHYQFCGLPAGSYYIIASIPDSLINKPDSSSTDSTANHSGVTAPAGVTSVFTPQSTSLPSTDSTAGNSGTTPLVTGSFTISCSNNNNNNVNIIIPVSQAACDDGCKARRPIQYKQLYQ